MCAMRGADTALLCSQVQAKERAEEQQRKCVDAKYQFAIVAAATVAVLAIAIHMRYAAPESFSGYAVCDVRYRPRPCSVVQDVAYAKSGTNVGHAATRVRY